MGCGSSNDTIDVVNKNCYDPIFTVRECKGEPSPSTAEMFKMMEEMGAGADPADSILTEANIVQKRKE